MGDALYIKLEQRYWRDSHRRARGCSPLSGRLAGRCHGECAGRRRKSGAAANACENELCAVSTCYISSTAGYNDGTTVTCGDTTRPCLR